MFEIHLTPKSKCFKPHIWKEGGEFYTEEQAEFHAHQIRTMKELYSKVEVVPVRNKNKNK